MILAIAFAHVWGVIQLVALGSLSRTVRVRTVLAALTVALYAIGPLTAFLQLGWIHLAASLLGTPTAQIQSIASYTVDPFLEEALKLLPLAMLLLLIPTVRRQWSVMDCVLIAAATGSGYGLAENLYRYAGSPNSAHAIAGGWAIVIGSHTLLVPGILNILTSWLPAGTVSANETISLNPHLVWSAIGGLAVGLIVRHRTRATRLVAGGLLFYIGLDHAAGNAALSRDNWLSPLTIQRVITGAVVWPLVLLITVATQTRTAWSVIVRLRQWSKARRLPMGDDAALVGLQLACGVGAVGLGGFTLMRVFGGLSAGSSLISGTHGADAANRLQPGGGVSVANGGGAFAPPPPSLDLPDAAPAAPPAPTPPSNEAPPAAQPRPHPPAPKSNPYDDAAAKAAARAAQADADALAARQFRTDAIRAADAADIAKATADPGADPAVAAVRERTRQANAASDAADQAALDPDDPWDPNAPNKTAADMFHKAAREAADDQQAAEDAFAERMAKDAADAKAAADAAERGVNEADATAATAREDAANAHAAAARAADPLGAAADQADKDYDAAHARENQAFYQTDDKAYQDARQAAMLAKEKADAARAAANAAKDSRSVMIVPVDKP